MRRGTFISHRHADHQIASVIRHHLNVWSVPAEEIFQSSSSQSGGKFGEPLQAEIRDALANSTLIILVYTFSEDDWDRCMFEVGIATDPDRTSKARRSVVFQCTEDRPRALDPDIMVTMKKEDIERFVRQVCLSDEFWPGENALREGPSEQVLVQFSQKFYSDLLDCVPEGATQEITRWDYFTLRLEKQKLAEILETQSGITQESMDQALLENCLIGRGFGQASKHFNIDKFPRKMSLGKLIEKWRQKIGKKTCSEEWIRSLLDEIKRCIRNEPSKPTFDLMVSVLPGFEGRLNPIVQHVRKLRDGSMEFDVYLYQVPGAALGEKVK